MALLGQNLDYTDKDFDSLRARLINLVRGAFPEWTDFNAANFGNILLECFAFVGDVLTYYQDNQAREAYIGSAQLRRSLLALAKLLNYTARGARAATTELTVTLAAPPVGDVEISAGDTFRTLEVTDPVVFQALSDATIVAGAVPPSIIVEVENSEGRQNVFQSEDTPNQEFQLPETPFLDDSLAVNATDGTYTEVADFLDSTATDRHYTVIVDENDRATVRFGNGVNGTIPTGTITCRYKVGGGTRGNVLPGTIRRADNSYTDTFGNPQNVSVTNQAQATGGAQRQTVESIRQLAPRSLRTLNRTVSREDYETNALRVPGVARAVCLTSNEKPGVPENQSELYIIPEGGGTSTQTLKDDVLEMVTETYPNTLTHIVNVYDAPSLLVEIVATVFIAQGYVPSEVGDAIRLRLAWWFSLRNQDGSLNENIGFGFEIDNEVAWSDVFNVIRDTEGVRKVADTPGAVQINGESNDLYVEPHEFPSLVRVFLYNGATGNRLEEETTA